MRRVTTGSALGALALLAGCGGGSGGDSTATGTATSTDGAVALRCAPGGAGRGDARGDVRARSASGPERAGRAPSVDLVAVDVLRGEDGVLCVRFRTAGTVRRGSTFAFITGQRGDEQRYEVQLAPDGRTIVSRPRGEPRYPVRARVSRRGDRLEVAMQTLLGPGGFDWRAEAEYLPRFPRGAAYHDAVSGEEG